MKKSIVSSALAALILSAVSAHAAIIISEVDAAGSGASYGTDWFELTNTGSSSVNLTGWKMDDSSAGFATSAPMTGVTVLAPGQSAVFLETTGSTAAFITAWFGAGGAPSGFLIGTYSGSGVGLSATADGVTIFDSAGTQQAIVTFGVSPTGATFDNSAGLTGAITTASVVGVNGAFTSPGSSEIGSPGVVPEASTSLAALAGLALLARRRR